MRCVETMPEEIQQALLEAEPKLTPQQLLNEASKSFKTGARRLRSLINGKGRARLAKAESTKKASKPCKGW